MAGRLDVTVAMNVIGEDKLQTALDQNSWYYLHMRNEGFDNGHFIVPMSLVNKLQRFKTPANPFEYLLFNEIAFLQEMSFIVMDRIYKGLNFENGDELAEWILDETHEITHEWANAVWDVLRRELSHNEMKTFTKNINNGSDELFFLFDKDFNQVFPNLSDEFLNKWFPR